MDAIAEVLAGRILGFCTHQDSDWRIYNGLHIDWYERVNPQELLADEEASRRESLRRVKSVPPAKWERDRGIRNWGWGSHRPADHAQDDGEEKHLAQLKTYSCRNGDRSAGKGARG